MQVFLLGYPGDLGGANTEAWHAISLWKRFGFDVHLIPTWDFDPKWKERVDALGCTTHRVAPESLESVPGLAGKPVAGFCNSHFIEQVPRLRAIGCPLVWVNCMTFLFQHELDCFRNSGLPEAFVFQSEFQRSELEPRLAEFGYRPETGHLIRGAFNLEEWRFSPRPHGENEEFFVGRPARPAQDKWSSNLIPIYERIQYHNKRGILLGVDDETRRKIGPPPWWIDYLRPMSVSPEQFYARLHCLLPVNGGARENWPRVGLEAMASGVPIVTQNAWGWREMIVHGETGFLGTHDSDLAHWAAVLAHDEPLRLKIAKRAHERLRDELANPEPIGARWRRLFESLVTK